MKRSVTRLFAAALNAWITLLSALLLVASVHTAGAAGVNFTALSVQMTDPRAGHTATLLPDGQVLLIGGENLCCGNGATYNTAELYDPVANTFTALTATMTTARENYTATLLPNGRVLLTGGFNDNSSDLDTAEVYDPVANSFTALTATMTSARSDQTATLLPNGLVLIAGGSYHSGTALNTAELYDPTANNFTALTARMTTGRTGHTATLLSNGQVLLTGGFNGSGTALNTAEMYDPVAHTFAALTATMTSARAVHTATLLPNGQVLIAGGGHGPESSSFTIVNTAEVYDPVANTFVALSATMTSARAVHTATQLPNGQVLLTGGVEGIAGTALDTAELYASGPANTATTTATATPTPTPTPTALPSSVLSSAIAATDTCIPVSDTSIFSPTGGFALIGTELISYTGLNTSCSGAAPARASAGPAATAGVLTGVTRNLNGQGGAHAAGTTVTPTAPPPACVGDCNGDRTVTVDEVLTLVNMALGNDGTCPGGLADGVTPDVSVILTAVNNALSGCGGP